MQCSDALPQEEYFLQCSKMRDMLGRFTKVQGPLSRPSTSPRRKVRQGAKF